MTVDRTISSKQIADRLGVIPGHVWRLYHEGKLHGADKIGCSVYGRIKKSETDLSKLITSRREDG